MVLSVKSGAAAWPFVAEVRSLAHVLGQTVGRTFQSSCDARWATRAAGSIWKMPPTKAMASITDLLRDRAFMATGCAGFAAGWFTSGTVTWTSGANAGRITEVLAHDLAGSIANLTLLEAPVRAIAEGDSFIARAGCDKRIDHLSGESSPTWPTFAASQHPRPRCRTALCQPGRWQ